ncbi:glycosyltransferase family A protein [Frigidibacter sp. MR17.14]|uniref:glycosyltransferase family 2 protein n=1 Tax=Frigidibacter sp. MR17.14 TaxID=3126509 RepID=UPI0030130E76
MSQALPPETMTAPLVCVVIPCHDRADTVEEAVRSVLEQTDAPPFEVVAVDDHSRDDTLAVLRRIDDPRLRIAENRGRPGVSATRNLGAALAAPSARWIAFQDSDDVWMPQKLSRQIARLEGSSFVASYCGMLVKADARPETRVQARFPDPSIAPLSGDILPSLARGSYLSTQMLVIRRDVYEATGGFDEVLQALVDWELMLRVAQAGPVDFVDEDLVVQRMSENSITRSSRKRLAAQAHILEKHGALLARYPGVLAHHHHRLAGAHRAFGEFAEAAAHAGLALRARPGDPKYLANLLYLRGRHRFG